MAWHRHGARPRSRSRSKQTTNRNQSLNVVVVRRSFKSLSKKPHRALSLSLTRSLTLLSPCSLSPAALTVLCSMVLPDRFAPVHGRVQVHCRAAHVSVGHVPPRASARKRSLQGKEQNLCFERLKKPHASSSNASQSVLSSFSVSLLLCFPLVALSRSLPQAITVNLCVSRAYMRSCVVSFHFLSTPSCRFVFPPRST